MRSEEELNASTNPDLHTYIQTYFHTSIAGNCRCGGGRGISPSEVGSIVDETWCKHGPQKQKWK